MYLKNILRGIFGLCFFFFNTSSTAQARNELWTKINITKSLCEQFDVGLDIQHRRQNGFENDKNMFHYGMTSSIRLWTYYKLKHNWAIIFSPLAYFDMRAIRNSSEEIQHSKEIRTMLGASKTILFHKFSNKNRLLYELSSIKPRTGQSAIRQCYRLQNRLNFPLYTFKNNTSLNYNISNEILIKTIHSSTAFDQEKLYNGIQLKLFKSDVNAGYQYTSQKDGNIHLNKNQFLLILNLNL